MNEQLLLTNIRSVLIRLEESIIFALIERAQFKQNTVIYDAGAKAIAINGESLVSHLLHETEKVHARLRRYTSPDEHPFFHDLPKPVLSPLYYHENPLHPNTVNLNDKIRLIYEERIMPYLCEPGDDGQYGSSAVSDVNCLQIMTKRIHYGKFVAESKYLEAPDSYQELIKSRDAERIEEAITDKAVEAKVLERVRLKAQHYGQDIEGASTQTKIQPEKVVDVYEKWIIPLTKKVEVQYLLQRL